MRFYRINQEELEGFPMLFVIGEFIGDRQDDGSITAYSDYAQISEDELRAMPGGPDALTTRWRSRDDGLWWDKSELAHAKAAALNDAEEALFSAFMPTERWDYFCEQFFGHTDPAKLTDQQLEWFGPRPPERLQSI